jgi:hypothetical protein
MLPTPISQRHDHIIRLGFALCVVSVTLLVGVSSLVILLLRGEVTYFVTSGGGRVRAGELADTFVIETVENIVRDRYTWTYVDIARAHALFKARLHPRLLKEFEQTIAPQEVQIAKEGKLGSGIALLQTVITERKGLERLVVVQAIRHKSVGGTLVFEDLTITIALVPLSDQGRPQDLRVWAMADTVPLRVGAR